MNSPGGRVRGTRRTRRSSSEVRRLILDAAEKLFSSNGYAGTTTDQIAAEAGVNNSVLYRNFRTKGELLREAVLKPFAEALEQFRGREPGPSYEEWPIERMTHDYVADMFEGLAEHRDALLGLVSAGDSLDPETSQRIAALIDGIVTEVTAIGVTEARRREDVSEVDMELTVRLVSAMIAGLVTFEPWFMPRGRRRLSRNRVIDHMTALMTYGLKLAPADQPKPELQSGSAAAPTT